MDQLLLNTSATSKQGKSTPRRLTFDNQSRYVRPVANNAIVWLDFEDVEGICPVQVSFGRPAIFVKGDNVGERLDTLIIPPQSYFRSLVW